MKKIVITLILVISMLLTSAVSPMAIAETKSNPNGTSYKTYTPPNMQGEVVLEKNTGDFNMVP